ncbi:MAG: oligosaccharide flippase family protein [Planctomycetota bacterium]
MQRPRSLSQRVGASAAVQIAGRLYSSALTFVITALLLTRVLGEAEYGVFAFHLTLYQLLNTMLDFGAGTVVIREASRDRAGAGPLIGLLIQLKLRFAWAGVVLLVAAAWIFEPAPLRLALLAIAALHVLAHAPAGAMVIFAVDMVFGLTTRAVIVGQTTWLALTLGLLAFDVTEPAAHLLAFGVGTVAHAAVGYSWARRRVEIQHTADPAARSALWREAWPAGISMTMAAVYFYIDAIMIRPILGEVAVAHYSAAYRLMTFVLMVPVLASQVLFPIFSRLWSRGPAALQPVYRRCTQVLFALGSLFPATLLLLDADLMALVYPADYGAGARSLGVLSLAVVFVFVAYPQVLALLAAGQQRLMMKLSIAGAVLNIALNAWWLPRYGIEGAAWATVATEAFIAVSSALAVHARTGLRLGLRLWLRPLACAALGAAALAWLLPALQGEPAAVRVAAGIGIGVLGTVLAGVWPLRLGEEGGPA